MGSEFYYMDKEGNKHDASLHDELLDNEEADTTDRFMAFNDVVQDRNLSVEEAIKSYQIKDSDLKSNQYREVKKYRDGLGKKTYFPQEK